MSLASCFLSIFFPFNHHWLEHRSVGPPPIKVEAVCTSLGERHSCTGALPRPNLIWYLWGDKGRPGNQMRCCLGEAHPCMAHLHHRTRPCCACCTDEQCATFLLQSVCVNAECLPAHVTLPAWLFTILKCRSTECKQTMLKYNCFKPTSPYSGIVLVEGQSAHGD